MKRYLPSIPGLNLVNLGMLFVVLLISTALVAIYIKNERFFYYFDWGGYYSVTIDYPAQLVQDPLQTILKIKDTINDEYNHFFILPLLPFLLAFGKSRLIYVLSLTLVYQIPYSLIAGGIATKLIPFHRDAVFWFAVLLTIATPIAWVPTLRTYPDIGAALLIGLAILVYIQDFRLHRWWQIPLIGILTGGALIYRRHYVFGSMALFEAMMVQAIVGFAAAFRQNRRLAWHIFLSTGVRIGITGVISLLVILLVGISFLENAMTTNYLALYSSYTLATGQVIAYFLRNYGWIIIALVTLGFSIGIGKRILDRPSALFLILFWVVSLLQWTFIVRQTGIHYTLHFMLPVILGTASLFWTIWLTTKGKLRAVLTAFIILVIATNLISGLTYVNISPKLDQWLSWRYPPLYRSDYDEVIKLVNFLRNTVSETAPIYVADSSKAMNYDLLIKAEQAIFSEQQHSILFTPQIDSRDFYPLEMLLKAEYVILSTPVQYHLSNPEEQKVVKVVSQAFTEKWEISEDFTRLPEQFSLADNVLLAIYQRKKPTSTETAVRTFAAMRDIIGRVPGNQSDWIIISPGKFGSLVHKGESAWNTSIHPEELGADYRLLFSHLTPAHGVIRGKLVYLEEQCVPTTLGVEIYDEAGQLTRRDELEIPAQENENDFELEFHSDKPNYLVFYATPDDSDSSDKACPIRIRWSLIE